MSNKTAEATRLLGRTTRLHKPLWLGDIKSTQPVIFQDRV